MCIVVLCHIESENVPPNVDFYVWMTAFEDVVDRFCSVGFAPKSVAFVGRLV